MEEWCGEASAGRLKQIEEFIDAKSGGSDQSSQGAWRKFGMLGNCEIGANARLRQNQVAPDLTADLPTSFLKSLRSVLARNVRQFPHDDAVLTSPILGAT